MSAIPYTRVAHILGIDRNNLPAWMQHHSVTATPTTLTGCPSALSSYQLTIAYKSGDDWMIYADKNSPTTNRHLSAVRAVIESLGFTPTDDIRIDRNGWNRTYAYRRYTKTA